MNERQANNVLRRFNRWRRNGTGKMQDGNQPRGLYGVGETEADAWADAARSAHNQAYWPRKPHNAGNQRAEARRAYDPLD